MDLLPVARKDLCQRSAFCALRLLLSWCGFSRGRLCSIALIAIAILVLVGFSVFLAFIVLNFGVPSTCQNCWLVCTVCDGLRDVVTVFVLPYVWVDLTVLPYVWVDLIVLVGWCFLHKFV